MKINFRSLSYLIRLQTYHYNTCSNNVYIKVAMTTYMNSIENSWYSTE